MRGFTQTQLDLQLGYTHRLSQSLGRFTFKEIPGTGITQTKKESEITILNPFPSISQLHHLAENCGNSGSSNA